MDVLSRPGIIQLRGSLKSVDTSLTGYSLKCCRRSEVEYCSTIL